MGSPAFQNLIYVSKDCEHLLTTVGHKHFNVTAKGDTKNMSCRPTHH